MMRPPLIQIFMMSPPKKSEKDDEDEGMLAKMLRMSMEMSDKMSEVSNGIKGLPHSEHAGGG